jgi:flagellar hook-associated protein 3 FlgL
MTLKVTNQMTFRLMQSEINNINRRLQDLRQEAATGKRFNKPSDDPSAVRPVLNYSKQIRANQRYQENMGMAQNKLQAQDSHMDHAEDTLVRAKQHTIRAISGAMNENDKEILADQVRQMKNELLSTANTQINERFLFSGYQEETQPFQKDADGTVRYHGDDNAREAEIAPGEQLEVSIPGRELFLGEKDTNGDGNADEKNGADAFRTLNNVEALMRQDNPQVSGSFGGNYEGWEYEDGNNFDTVTFDLELAGESLTGGGSQIEVDMSVVSSENAGDIADAVGSEIVTKTGVGGSLGSDGDSVTITNSSGDEVTITRSGDSFEFETTNGAPFRIASFQESSTDNNAGPDLNRAAVMRVSSDPGSKGDAILQSGDSTTIAGTDLNEQLGELDEAMTRFRKYRGEMGINMNRLETSIDAKAQAENDLKQILGKYENADITETSSQIVQRETALKAALSVTSRMAKISILNYM